MKLSLKSLAKELSQMKKEIKDLYGRLPDAPVASRFADNGNGTITDKDSNLDWLKEDDGKKRTWQEAKDYCESLKLAGGGWRMPTRLELESILDFTRCNPAIDPIFTNTKSYYYWSSTPYAYDSGGAWNVGFGSGVVDWGGVDGSYCVRPVRQNSLGSSTL